MTRETAKIKVELLDDYLSHTCQDYGERDHEAMMMAIKALETFKWCTDCKEYDQEKHCCHRWSKVIRNTVEEMKQEQEPRKGYWLRRPHVYGVTYCSVCDFELKIDNTNYCPKCGAKMEVEDGNGKRK